MLQGRTPLLLAAIFAVLAALVASVAIESARDEIKSGWEPERVAVAKGDIAVGERLSQSNIGVGRIPKSMITPSVITYRDIKSGEVPVWGQKAALAMHAGDTLLYHHIQTEAAGQTLAHSVSPPKQNQSGGRAISIRVSAESSVHHWVAPGDHVDIIGIFRDPRTQQSVSVTLLQNVGILATGRIRGSTRRRALNPDELAYRTVTVQVLPEAAEMLVLAQQSGVLYLTLRHPQDDKINDFSDSKTTVGTLLTGERSKRISARQSKVFKVEIIRGNQSEEQVVP